MSCCSIASCQCSEEAARRKRPVQGSAVVVGVKNSNVPKKKRKVERGGKSRKDNSREQLVVLLQSSNQLHSTSMRKD